MPGDHLLVALGERESKGDLPLIVAERKVVAGRKRVELLALGARRRTAGEASVTDDGVVDVTILGAGTTGLAAAYYVGHRGGSVRIVESLELIGGEVAATYPEKEVYDVAGFPKILGRELVELCAEQGLQYGADLRLGEEARTLRRVAANGERLLAFGTSKGNTYLSRAMIITAGQRAFEHRRLGAKIDERDVHRSSSTR